jgi:hypothetical protein
MSEHPDQARVNAERKRLAEEAAKVEPKKKEEPKYRWQPPEAPAKGESSE